MKKNLLKCVCLNEKSYFRINLRLTCFYLIYLEDLFLSVCGGSLISSVVFRTVDVAILLCSLENVYAVSSF